MTTEYANNATTTLSANFLAGQLTVNVNDDTNFPVVSSPDVFYATIENNNGDYEIIKVTNHAALSGTMTVERAQEGTTDQSWNSGDLIELRPTAGIFEELRDHTHTQFPTLAGNNVYTGDNDYTGTFKIGGTVVTATGSELNVMDGDTTDSAIVVATGDTVVVNDSGVMVQTNVDSLDTYLSDTTKTLNNKTIAAAAYTGTQTGFTGNITGNATGSSGSCTGNSATASAFNSSRTVQLTGDVTGSSSSSNGVHTISTTAGAALTSGWKLLDTDVRNNTTGSSTMGPFNTTYDEYLLVGYNLTRLGSDGDLYCRLRNSSADVGTEHTILNMDTTVDSQFHSTLYLPRSSKAQYHEIYGVENGGGTPGLIQSYLSSGLTGVFDELRLYTVGNAQMTGTFKLYGR